MTVGPEGTMLSSEVTIFSKIGVVGSGCGTRGSPGSRLLAGYGQARPCRVTPGRADPSRGRGGRQVTMVESRNTPDPTQGQAPGQAGVAAARTAGCGQQRGHRADGQAEPQMIRTHHRQRGAGAQVVRRLNSPTDDPSWGPPITRRTPTGSAPATAGTPSGVPARCVCGRPRQPALRERLSITPRKPDGVNHPFPTDQPPGLAASPPECYRSRPRP